MRKEYWIIIMAMLYCIPSASQELSEEFQKEVIAFQQELNREYQDPDSSPLEKKALRKFKGHPFFPINEKYRVTAKFIKNNNPTPFQMKTTTDRLPTYDKYGEVVFEIEGKEYRLSVYQSHQLRGVKKYEDYLFLPFMDLTNGKTSYGGGRYIDFAIPSGDTVIIDFNKAYTPYCAYNSRYSCPIPPQENQLSIKIEAGVMYQK